MSSKLQGSLSSSNTQELFQLAAKGGGGITATRLLSGPGAGVELVELNTGPLKVWIVPTRGMGIWRAELNGIPVEWKSPVRQLVHPGLVNLQARNGLGWLDGFNELLCRCGLASNGPPGNDAGARSPIESDLTLHGKIANIPATDVQARIEGKKLICEGTVYESTLFGPQLELKSRVETTLGSSEFEITDEITNIGSTETELQLLYHTNIGAPFLDEGAHIRIPHKQVAPRDARAAEGIGTYDVCLGPTPGYSEQAYFYEPLAGTDGRTVAMLQNAAGDRAVSVSFHPSELPCFVTWKCTQPTSDGYVVGLEPAMNFPNHKSFERKSGRVLSMAPGGKHKSRLRIGVHDTRDSVLNVEAWIASIQGMSKPTVHRTPLKGWSA
jgi:hypothetical protein